MAHTIRITLAWPDVLPSQIKMKNFAYVLFCANAWLIFYFFRRSGDDRRLTLIPVLNVGFFAVEAWMLSYSKLVAVIVLSAISIATIIVIQYYFARKDTDTVDKSD